jgi:general secretion pathway protein K
VGRAAKRAGGTAARKGGFVLIPVLAALFLLSLGVVVLTKSVALDIKATALMARRAVAEELTDGVTRLAIRHLVVNQPSGGRSAAFRLDGVPLTCRLGDSLVRISFIDADGQVNLNRASPALLQRTFVGVGLTEDDAKRLADNVIDFRSSGEDSVAGGKKLAAYQLAGLNHGPKRDVFATVGELDQVVGMTTQLLARLKPIMTVHSRFGTINPRIASFPVLVALSGGAAPASGGSSIQALDELQSSVILPTEFTYITQTRSVRQTGSNAYMVRVAVNQGSNARFGREAAVELGASSDSGATIKEWIEFDPPSQTFGVLKLDETPTCLGGVLLLDAP